MVSSDDEALVRNAHQTYFQALSSGNMDALADCFAFPAAFKGFLEDVVLATDKASLVATYKQLIAAAPKAARTELSSTEVSYLRPGVYTLTMTYEQFGPDDRSIHAGRAVYFMKRVNEGFKLFGVF